MRTRQHINHLFLTGATGFFGKALLRHWSASSARPDRVTALSRDPEIFASQYPSLANLPFLSWHQGDIEDFDSLPLKSSFSHVLHAAADSTYGALLPPHRRFEQIVYGTRNVLEVTRRSGATRFLITSSGAVYGGIGHKAKGYKECDALQVNPLRAESAYAIGKIAAEHLCTLYSSHFEPVIARCFAFVGPDLPLQSHFAIGNFIHDALNNESITIQSDGSAYRSYMDQRDLARWLTILLLYGTPGEAYNVGSGDAISILELANAVGRILAPRKQVRVLGYADPSIIRHRYYPNTDKATRTLGLKTTFALDDAIRYCASEHSLHKSEPEARIHDLPFGAEGFARRLQNGRSEVFEFAQEDFEGIANTSD